MRDFNQNNNPNYKHGLCKTRLYRIWANAKSRCGDKNNPLFKYYGEIGIKVCDEWLNDFQAFYDWSMANGYKHNLTIDRINYNGNYEPSNCRWVTMKAQARNRKSNRIIEFQGERKHIIDWAKVLGINAKTLYSRFDKGWSVEKALTTPTRKRNK